MQLFNTFSKLMMVSSTIVNAIPIKTIETQASPLAFQEKTETVEQSFEFINYINNLININSTIKLEHSEEYAVAVQDMWYENAHQVNSSIVIQYDTLVNWNENKKPQSHISYSSNEDELKDLTFFNYESNFSIISSIGSIQFNSAELTLAAKKDAYQSIMEDVSLNIDGFYKCSEYKNKLITFELEGKILSIPLINLSWNHYEATQDLCEPMISVLDNESPIDMIFGEYVMQNLILNFQSKRLGLAPNAPGVTFA